MVFDKPILIVAAGAPGSGKSTVINDIAERYGFAVVCPDSIRAELFGDEGEQREGWRVFQLAFERMRSWLAQPDCPGVIFDATNCRRRSRRDVLEEAEGCFATAICAVSDADLETCLYRNSLRERHVPEDVIENMHANLWNNWPDSSEGFDYIVVLDQLESLL